MALVKGAGKIPGAVFAEDRDGGRLHVVTPIATARCLVDIVDGSKA